MFLRIYYFLVWWSSHYMDEPPQFTVFQRPLRACLGRRNAYGFDWGSPNDGREVREEFLRKVGLSFILTYWNIIEIASIYLWKQKHNYEFVGYQFLRWSCDIPVFEEERRIIYFELTGSGKFKEKCLLGGKSSILLGAINNSKPVEKKSAGCLIPI